MANILHRPPWYLAEKQVTAEAAYANRRAFLKTLGLSGLALAATPLLAHAQAPAGASKLYPAKRHPDFNPKVALTDEKPVLNYNNFYEFSLDKEKVAGLTGKFVIDPWKIEVDGLVEKPLTLDLNDLVNSITLEERVYRFRCVEAWAMVVPWTGFPLSKLIEKCRPKPEAKYIRFETFNRPEQAPGMVRKPNYPWPYFEGLRMDEAMHPLTLVATGLYGTPLPKQNGAPVRLVVPWKYGYKSIKSIVKISFVSKQPTTFWETLAADEYPFESNVNPDIPHPRWSQRTEMMIDTRDRVKTQPYNGYGDLVGRLYAKS